RDKLVTGVQTCALPISRQSCRVFPPCGGVPAARRSRASGEGASRSGGPQSSAGCEVQSRSPGSQGQLYWFFVQTMIDSGVDCVPLITPDLFSTTILVLSDDLEALRLSRRDRDGIVMNSREIGRFAVD